MVWRCSPLNGVPDFPMAPGLNLSRLERAPGGMGWVEVPLGEPLDPDGDYELPDDDRCKTDTFYCEFLNFVTEPGQTAFFDLALQSLPPTSPVTVWIHPDPEFFVRDINNIRQVAVSPTSVVFTEENYTETVRARVAFFDFRSRD